MATGAAYGIDRQTCVVHRVACDRFENVDFHSASL